MHTPHHEYATRKSDREATAAARERVHVNLGNAKVAIFIAAIVYTGARLGSLSSTVYGTLIVLFVVLAVWHEFVMRALARAQAAVRYYADGQARIEDRWMRDTPSGERFRDPASPLSGLVITGRDHPYADDLDVFGPRSLFQLLSSCRTPMGEERLALWLLRASPVVEIRERQGRVAALRSRIDLRERIAVVNAGRRRSMHAERLIAWSEQARTLPPLRIVVVIMAVLFMAALGTYMNGGSGWGLVIVPIINLALIGMLGKRANDVVETLSAATESAALDLFANVIAEIEREDIDSEAMTALTRQLSSSGAPASTGLARLARISDWADSRHNVFLRLAEIPLLFTLQVAYAAESWRGRHGRDTRQWVDAVAEIEALLSLSGYSFEHPADPFPELVESDTPFIDATEMAHPLIASDTAISNSLKLGASSSRVLMVSGSNMAGKSTLMRTVGINALLALAGAPVRAQRLRLSPLQIGTCLRHSDSLQEQRSGFYTEALRIRLICDLLDGPRPLLFLFDELLSGTNSKDRRVAAEGVVRTMLARRAIGMVTTHDLSLTEIAGLFAGEVWNVHLQDKVEDGQMSFDYKLRDGVITHSNALELMRMIGLDV